MIGFILFLNQDSMTFSCFMIISAFLTVSFKYQTTCSTATQLTLPQFWGNDFTN